MRRIHPGLVLFLSVMLMLAATGVLAAGSAKFVSALTKAQSGDVDSQLAVGRFYARGIGTEKNLGLALSWYLEAAAQNNAEAMHRAGIIYFKGLGKVPRSYIAARRWFEKASQQNHAGAESYLARIYAGGLGVKKDAKLASAWEKLSQAHSSQTNQAIVTDAIDTKVEKSTIRVSRDELIQSVLFQLWAEGSKAVNFLPSERSTCGRRKFGVFCTSLPSSGQRGNLEFDYVVDTRITDFSNKGNTFNIEYRNNVTAVRSLVDVPAEQAGSIKTGKQKRAHKLACVLVNKDRISCIKNGRSRKEFKRVKL